MHGLTASERQAYCTPDNIDLVNEVVAQALNMRVILAEHDPQGHTTVAFQCEAACGSYIVRRGKDEVPFRKDQLVGKYFSHDEALSVPVPEVRDIVRLNDDSYLCISSRAPGVPANDTALYTFGTSLNEALMLTLQELHQVPVSVVLDPQLFAPLKRHLAAAAYAKAQPDTPHNLDLHTLKQITQVQQRLQSFIAPGLGRLCHNDIKGANLLVENDAITGVIDWAMADVGDPASDLGRLYASCPDAIDYSRYELAGEAIHHLQERVLYYAMTACVGTIRFFSGIGDPVETAKGERRLLELTNEAES